MRDGMGNIVRMISDLHDQDNVLQLESAVGEIELKLNALREGSKIKDERIARLQDDNIRLQNFADAVRQNLAYRLYSALVKPFKNSQARHNSRTPIENS